MKNLNILALIIISVIVPESLFPNGEEVVQMDRGELLKQRTDFRIKKISEIFQLSEVQKDSLPEILKEESELISELQESVINPTPEDLKKRDIIFDETNNRIFDLLTEEQKEKYPEFLKMQKEAREYELRQFSKPIGEASVVETP